MSFAFGRLGSSFGRMGGAGLSNKLPRIALSNGAQAEGTSIGTVIGALSVLHGSGSYTFTITADPDSAFSITGANLKNAAVFNYEAAVSHSVTIQADNGVDSVLTRTFVIVVGNVDDAAPVISTASTANCAENAALAIALAATLDGAAASVAWSIVGGADQTKFEISGTTLRWASNGTKDYETPDDADTDNAYIVTVRATDSPGGLTTDKTITVTVTDAVGEPVSPLVNTIAPSLTGTEEVDSTLGGDDGTWTGSPTSFTYVWKRATTNEGEIVMSGGYKVGVSIGGATAATYDAVADDEGLFLFREVTAHKAGTADVMAQSNATGAIAAAPVSADTFDAPNKGDSLTLTNGDLDLTASGAWGSAQTIAGKSSGKWYAKFKKTAGSGSGTFWGIGICDTQVSAMSNYLGGLTNSASVIASDTFANGFTGATSPSLSGQAVDDEFVVAFDVDAKKAWVALNDVWLAGGDPATGANPWLTWASSFTIHAAIAGNEIGITIRYLAGEAMASPPAGFSVLT